MTNRDSSGGRPRRASAVSAAAAAGALLAALAGCSAGPGTAAGTSATASVSPVNAAPARTAASPAASPTTTSPATAKPAPAQPAALPVAPSGAGARPQTSARPHTDDTAFKNAVRDIWLAVVTGDPEYARPAFFPEKAYQQVKAIANPASDWQGRLWYDFTLDLAATHKLVRPGAKLVRVVVPAQYEQWVPAGACYNSVGYWHAPGSRVVYRQDGATRSFGIASFISWRGVWYLVHFGAVVRSGAFGIVDDPEAGEGVPGPPGDC